MENVLGSEDLKLEEEEKKSDEDLKKDGKEEKKKEEEKEENIDLGLSDESIDSNSNIDMESLAKANYKMFVEEGILKEGLEVNNFDDLKNHVEDLKLVGINEWRKELPEELNNSVEAWSKGLDYKAVRQRRMEVTEYKSVTDDMLKDEKVALKIIKEHHKYLGDSDEYIKDRLDDIIDSDVIIREAKRSRSAMTKVMENREKLKNDKDLYEQENKKKEYNDYKENLKKQVSNSDLFWGKKLSNIEQQELIDVIFNPEVVTKKNKDHVSLEKALADNPVIYAQIYYAYMKGMFGEKGNLNFIKNTVKSQAVNDIDKILKGNSVNTFRDKPSDDENIGGMKFMQEIASKLKP